MLCTTLSRLFLDLSLVLFLLSFFLALLSLSGVVLFLRLLRWLCGRLFSGGAIGRSNMDPIIGGAIASGAGSMVSSAANFLLQRDQRGWQEKMANTAYQRATADMEKAGLNPALMYGSGSKADTPNVQPPTVSDPTQNVFSAINAARTAAEIEQVKAQADATAAQAARTKVGTALDTLNLTYGREFEGKRRQAEIDSLQAHALQAGNSALNIEAERPFKQLLGNVGKSGNSFFDLADKFGKPGQIGSGLIDGVLKLYESGGPFMMLYKAFQDAKPGQRNGGPSSARSFERR